MKLVTTFFGFGLLFLSGLFFVPEVQAQTCSGGNCVSDPAACSGTWNIDDNCPSRYCCQGSTTPTGNAGALCTASDDGSQGTCAAQLSCPTGSYVHRSADCTGATPDCCTSSGGGGTTNACVGAGTNYFCSATSNCGGTGYERLSSRDEACGTGRYCCKPVSTTTGGGTGTDTSGGWTTGFQSARDQSELPNATIRQIVSGFMMWLLAILGFIAIIAFVVSGLLYLTAAGNDGQIKTAKAAMTWSIVGVIVALVGYVIILAADFLLSGS
ncbi:MAG: pilin [Candidatus Moraniibacteriota bacterium]